LVAHLRKVPIFRGAHLCVVKPNALVLSKRRRQTRRGNRHHPAIQAQEGGTLDVESSRSMALVKNPEETHLLAEAAWYINPDPSPIGRVV
jgi:hypothetical protein